MNNDIKYLDFSPVNQKQKRPRKKIKKKLKFIIILILLMLCLSVLLVFMINKSESAGTIKNGKITYSDKINNVSYINNKQIIELKSIDSQIDNLVINNEMINEIKNNSEKYDQTLKEILESSDTSKQDIYNIQKAIDLKIVSEKTSLKLYYAKITGFKNVKKFVNFCEAVFELIKEDNK